MQKPTQTLRSVKGLGTNFDLDPKWARNLPSEILHGIFRDPPLTQICFIEVDIWHPVVGLMCRNLPMALKSVKGLDTIFDLSTKWARGLLSDILYGVFVEPPPILFYRSWHLTPCCGLELQKSTQALKSVRCLGNTFDLISKWTRTLPSGILHGILIDPSPIVFIEVDIWHRAVGLRCRNPPMELTYAPGWVSAP
jgi:hypothetical protein